jgi:hypothetical protein
MNCLVKLAKAADLEMVLYARFELISDLRWIFDSKPNEIPKTLIQQSWQKQVSHILYNSHQEVQQNQVYHLGDVCTLSAQALKKLFKKPFLSHKSFLDKFFIGIQDFRDKVPNCETRIVIRSSSQVCEEDVLSDSEQPYEPADYNIVPIENYMSPSQNSSSNIPLVSSNRTNTGRTTSSEIVIENDSMDQVRLFRTRSDIIQQQSTGYSMSQWVFYSHSFGIPKGRISSEKY